MLKNQLLNRNSFRGFASCALALTKDGLQKSAGKCRVINQKSNPSSVVFHTRYNCLERRLLSTAENGGKKIAEKEPLGPHVISSTGEITKMKQFQDEVIVVSDTIRYKNFGVAVVLMGFVAAVFFYSLHAVGQATFGGRERETDDPLERLKLEAQEAYEKEEKEKETQKADFETTQNMLQEFQSGDLDVDKIVDADDVASLDALLDKEDEENRRLNEGEKKKRSLLNRVVFFWR